MRNSLETMAGILVITVSMLVIACTPAATPTPTTTPTPSPTSSPTPASTVPSRPQGTPKLLDALKKMPDTWRDEGVWFEDWGRAFRLAGVTPFRTVEEMLSMTREQQQPYWDARAGIAPEPIVLESSRRHATDWQEAFGFNSYQVDVAIGPGRTYTDSTMPAYIEGAFDPASIRQKLSALGYQEWQAEGRTYYAIRDDFAATVNDPARFAHATMNRVYVQEGAMATAPATAQMEGILGAWGGESPSLADAPAFASVAAALGDPLSAAILPRAVALDVSNTRVWLSPSTPGTVSWPPLQKEPGWGSLHEWETVGVGYTKSENGQRWYTFALYYPDKSAAAADASELKRRMETYESAAPEEMLERGWPARPLGICGPLAADVAELAEGSTLAVWCPLSEDVTIGWGQTYDTSTDQTSWAGVNAWFMYLDMKDIAFLCRKAWTRVSLDTPDCRGHPLDLALCPLSLTRPPFASSSARRMKRDGPIDLPQVHPVHWREPLVLGHDVGAPAWCGPGSGGA